jgi:hypothetical protein
MPTISSFRSAGLDAAATNGFSANCGQSQFIVLTAKRMAAFERSIGPKSTHKGRSR